MRYQLEGDLWSLDELREWAWNPLIYTGLTGSAIYNLMAREFAPLPERLQHVTERLEQFPRLFAQIRATLEIDRVPKVHSETAVKQSRGVLSVLDNFVTPNLSSLPGEQRVRLEKAIAESRDVVDEHQRWLEEELLPNARGDFRLGARLYDQTLAFTLKTAMTRDEAMRLMMEDTFQEEREAAAKWVRAQLTSAQLSTYFVGTIEHFDLRRDIERAWGDDFDLKTYHDKILSFGSPPVQVARALILDEPIGTQ